MRYIIRPDRLGSCGLGLVFLFSITVALAQQTPAIPKTADQTTGKDAAQVASTPPTVPPAAADVAPPPPPSESAKPQEAVPPPVSANMPEDVKTQGKGSSKKDKSRDRAGTAIPRGNSPTFTGVDSKPYEIGPEDVLFLNVLHSNDVTGQIVVRPDGFVTIRYIGDIKAAGLTVQRLTDVVTEKLNTYFNHPEVNIQVVVIRSKKYYLSGEVKKPGSYSLATPKTVLEALIEGGGPADFAKTKKIYVLRGQRRLAFNYNDVSKGRHMEQNILLQNGDVVVVP